MRRVLMLALILTPTLPACVPFAGGRPIVTTQRAGCSTLVPTEWENGVPPAEIPRGIVTGTATVGDWQVLADREAARGDTADERTKATIHIYRSCEARDAAAVGQATRRRFLGVF